MKGNPADVRGLAEDLTRAIAEHPDACRLNPDLYADLVKLRDRVKVRYDQISESGSEPTV